MTNTMSCGCEIISDNLGAYKIEYCPKHKAAPDMYEALWGMIKAWEELHPDLHPNMAKLALAKADGKLD